MPADALRPSALLEASDLTVEYIRGSWLRRFSPLVAVRQVNIRIREGSVTGIAGSSGSGKSTLARCICGLETPTSGMVRYRDRDLALTDKNVLKEHRQKVQLVSQEPALTINPRFTAARAIAEPLEIAGFGNPKVQREQAITWMERVGLRADAADRPALQFSGGQRYRIAIARSLIIRPELMIFDESFSALDVPVRNRILELLRESQTSERLTYVFISHDLGLLTRNCEEIFVMHQGQVVEAAAPHEILTAPLHSHTRQLVAAIPGLPAGWHS